MNQLALQDWADQHAHRHDPDTSSAAAARARVFTAGHCERILRRLDYHSDGLTSQEIAVFIRLTYHAVARRIADLKHAGLVVDSGLRRENPSGRMAAVWRVSP